VRACVCVCVGVSGVSVCAGVSVCGYAGAYVHVLVDAYDCACVCFGM